MKVALDARKVFDGGIGTYIRGLLGAVAVAHPDDEWTALVDPVDTGLVPWPDAVREREARAGKYGLAEHFAIPAAARRAGAELLHAPHYTLPLAWGGPAVVTIHDLIHIRFPRFHRPGTALYARVMAGLAARRARIVIADSQATKRDIVELLGTPEEKVRVVSLGVSGEIRRRAVDEVERFRAVHGLPEGYMLYVGARKGHKNLELLLRASAIMRASQRPPLVLSGWKWAGDEPLAKLAASLGITDAIRFAGDLEGDDKLSCLYSGASLLVQPSLAEGFGLPPLEAMACGVPVLSSDAGSLPEVLGDAAEYLPPREPGRWAATLERLLNDRARLAEMGARGRARAAQYTWEQTARATHAIYAEALSTRSRP